MKELSHRFRILVLAGLLATAPAMPAAAQGTSSWQAFFGCWASARPGAQEGDGETVLCFRPSGEGVEVSTLVDGEETGAEILVADGRQRDTQVQACTGYRSTEFSADGDRAFLSSELTCDGETRTSSGVMAFVSTNRLLHFREVEIAGEPVSWIEEYHPVTSQWFAENGVEDPTVNLQYALAVRTRAARAITIPDVEEAASRVGPGALQLWIAAQPSDFELDGQGIVHLADSGVPESVIDVMVAAAFPDHFAVSLEDGTTTIAENRPSAQGRYAPSFGAYRSYLFDPFFLPSFYTYGAFGAYNAFGYPLLPGYLYSPGYLYAGRPLTIVVQPQPQPQQPQGRMVNGLGYSRNAPAGNAAPAPIRASGAPAPSQPSSSPSAGASSSGGSAPAPSSSATPTGRTAQPRN
jgi:hypothetical protein